MSQSISFFIKQQKYNFLSWTPFLSFFLKPGRSCILKNMNSKSQKIKFSILVCKDLTMLLNITFGDLYIPNFQMFPILKFSKPVRQVMLKIEVKSIVWRCWGQTKKVACNNEQLMSMKHAVNQCLSGLEQSYKSKGHSIKGNISLVLCFG